MAKYNIKYQTENFSFQAAWLSYAHTSSQSERQQSPWKQVSYLQELHKEISW